MCKNCRSFSPLGINVYDKSNVKSFYLIGICEEKDSTHYKHILSQDHPKCICRDKPRRNNENNKVLSNK